MSRKFYQPSLFFNGEKFIEDQLIVTNNGKVESILPVDKTPANTELISLPQKTIAPAYKDLQINGARGIMFSAQPSVKALKAIYSYSIEGGATQFMATLPTNSLEVIEQSIAAVLEYWDQGLPGLLGLHLEGPYINPIKKGAHNESLIQKPTLSGVKELLKRGKGVIKMITLAPECCPDKVIEYLVDQGIVLSAGHSNATYEEAKHGFSLGINMCTHLYNAMSPFTHRAPGLVGATFDSNVYSGIIPDGIHTDEAAFRIASKIMGDRLFLVTDAITETKNELYQYIHKGDRYVTEKGTLAGSCLTMESAVQKSIQMGIKPEHALKGASYTPSKSIGKHSIWGKIAPGYEVDWVVLDENFKVEKTITK